MIKRIKQLVGAAKHLAAAHKAKRKSRRLHKAIMAGKAPRGRTV